MNDTLFIDATSATDRLTGIERYTRELVKAIAEQRSGRSGITTILLSHNSDWLSGNDSGITVKLSPFTSRLLTEQIWVPYMVAKLRPNCCFFPAFPPNPLIVLSKRSRIIHTVFDATMWKFPETLSWKNKVYMRPLETFAMHRYDVIHTISSSSASEISDCFPAVREKMVVSGIGVDVDSFSRDPGTEVMDQTVRHFGLPSQFILFIGTLEPRKNLGCLIIAFDLLAKHDSTCGLVLAGRLGWGADEVKKRIADLGLESRVLLTGAVSEDELLCLYKLATVVAFPSIHEGFGLPVVEAMAAGTPVVASNTSSIPEAAGDAALLLSPHHPELWAQALRTVLDNEHTRLRMREKGFAQARRFSWQAVAQKVLHTV